MIVLKDINSRRSKEKEEGKIALAILLVTIKFHGKKIRARIGMAISKETILDPSKRPNLNRTTSPAFQTKGEMLNSIGKSIGSMARVVIHSL